MKKIILSLMLIICITETYSQSLTVFDIDTSNYPTVKAKFFAFDGTGNQLRNFSISDFTIAENGTNVKISSISCPSPKPPEALSSVLVMDASGSMVETNLTLAKEAAKAWIEALPLGKSDCAITGFDDSNYLIQDFTTSRQLLLEKAGTLFASGGTDYDAGFINPMAGGLIVANKGTRKKVIVFLTDGIPNETPQVSKIINDAKAMGLSIYSVTLNMDCPLCLQEISNKTGGKWFGNVSSIEEAKSVYQIILRDAQGGEPCEIEWESDISCELYKDLEITCHTIGKTAKTNYEIGVDNTAHLEPFPTQIQFGVIQPGKSKDTLITVTARNSDFRVFNIETANSDFKITPTKFSLSEGKSRQVKVTYTPTDTGYAFSKFNFDASPCP